MPYRSFPLRLLATAVVALWAASLAVADPPKDGKPQTGSPTQAKPKHPPFAEVVSDAEPVEGLIKLYRKDMHLYAEIAPGDLNKDLLVAIAIARGIAQMPLVGGMTLDDWVWQFRKVDDRIQIVRRNIRFQAAKGSPLEKSVHISYTDSILFSLPIVTTSPSGGSVIDLAPVFMSDLPQISSVLHGFAFDPNRSSWVKAKGFKNNVELEVAATYASGGQRSFDTVTDSRGATLYIHYSISRLPETGYQPRLADDRVGHFVTVIKDFSKVGGQDQFIRYINRWDLRKVEPSLAVSPPVTPIIFWIEKTVPYRFRAAVREGILEWNKAFEKAGFSNAIEVRQQPDDATWDPEDINYNTFRWITTSAAGFAMGPSRVNPLTGQILDADIIFDADFIEHWVRVFHVEKPELSGVLSDVAQSDDGDTESMQRLLSGSRHDHGMGCDCAHQMAQQLGFGAIAMAASGKAVSHEQIEKLLAEGVKFTVSHEIGHTLGLRHNFKASALFTMDEVSNPEKTRDIGIAASVMDYVPLNVAPKGKRQGDVFSRTIGPYDYWAIEYAYKPFPAKDEAADLAKIASRSSEPALRYATDEDAANSDCDPLVNRFDLSSEPVEFAKWRVELINQLLPGLVEQMVEPGEGYQRVRQALSILLTEHDRAMHCVARMIGGVYVNRSHKGDPNAQPTFVVTEAKTQREALEFLEQQVLGPGAYQFPSKLYEYLAPAFWMHWGAKPLTRKDLAVHQMVLQMQDHVLKQILSPTTLARLVDSETQVPAKQDVFTAADLFESLTASIFSELGKLQEGKYTNREPAISSLRRNLQKHYFEQLADIVLGETPVPTDCQNVAYAQLQVLEGRIKKALAGEAKLDTYTRSHLSELAAQIHKVLDARIELKQP